MKIPAPEFTRYLVDVCQENGAEVVWNKLASGEIPSSHWDLDTGEFESIDPAEWRRQVSIVEPSGKVVKRHALELLIDGNLSWLRSNRVGTDPVLVPNMDALQTADGAGTAEQPKQRVAAVVKQATGRPTKHDWEGATIEIGAAFFAGEIKLPSSQSEIAARIADWFSEQGLSVPEDGDRRKLAKRILDAMTEA
ncbi:MAG: hypothetical protein ACOH2M_26510 [Cypionkella sp.]